MYEHATPLESTDTVKNGIRRYAVRVDCFGKVSNKLHLFFTQLRLGNGRVLDIHIQESPAYRGEEPGSAGGVFVAIVEGDDDMRYRISVRVPCVTFFATTASTTAEWFDIRATR